MAIHMDNYFPWGDNTQNTIVDSRTRATIPAPNSLGAVAAGTTSVARGVLVGAQGGMFANGGSPGPTDQPLRAQWVEELVDANAKLRITAGMTWGFKKTRFRNLLDVNDIGEDFATITLSTYASPSGA